MTDLMITHNHNRHNNKIKKQSSNAKLKARLVAYAVILLANSPRP